MNKTYIVGGIIVVLVILAFAFGSSSPERVNTETGTNASTTAEVAPVKVTPVSHAAGVLEWDGLTIYTDPTGSSTAFTGKPHANIILITDIHGDHFSTSTLLFVAGSSTLIVPKAVKDLLPQKLAAQAKVLKNGETMTEQGFSITGVPMYNLPESSDSRHVKGRGNGYVVERDGYRVYIAGDTAGTPEMRRLMRIDMAFVPMNPPFTMTVEEAADAVLDFKPKIVYPYHYRGQNGLSDIVKFGELVNAGDSRVQVVLLDWYPTQ